MNWNNLSMEEFLDIISTYRKDIGNIVLKSIAHNGSNEQKMTFEIILNPLLASFKKDTEETKKRTEKKLDTMIKHKDGKKLPKKMRNKNKKKGK